jgi:hypothetical protein
MTSGSDPLAFTKLMPGFDFMRQFAQAAANKSATPHAADWVAPTVSIEELDKRIADLKAVQFWLEQNVHLLRATMQALQVQKMTLAALQGMNLNLADVAKVFAAPAQQPQPAPTASPEPSAMASETAGAAAEPAPAPAVTDPLQWWDALTQQFQAIAASALPEAAQAGAPSPMPAGPAGDSAPAAKPARKSAAAKPAAKRSAPKKPAQSAARRGLA